MFYYLTEPNNIEIDFIGKFESRHLVSEPHIRIQTSEIPFIKDEKYFEFHGEVLIIILDGCGILKTKTRSFELKTNDQILLTNEDSFFLTSKDENTRLKVEFIWTPGLYVCKKCWETGNRFYLKDTNK